MKTLINYSLQQDLYSIIEAGTLLQCKEVDGKHFIEWIILKNPLHKLSYHYPNRQAMMEDHYELAKIHFAVNRLEYKRD